MDSKDPTGQAANRRRAKRRLTTRLKNAQTLIKRLFRRIPRTRRRQAQLVNKQLSLYDYEIGARGLSEFEREIERILNAELETESETVPPFWWWGQEEIEPPYREGALATLVVLSRELLRRQTETVTSPTLAPERLITSSSYQRDLAVSINSNYPTLKGLSDNTAKQVMQQINLGIEAHLTPTQISQNISGRFDVALSSARRIAETEINKAYNDAELNTINTISEETGVRMGVLHVSALLPTTRGTHAERHGNVYTTEAQQQWWNQGANRINCKCSVIPAVLNTRGQPENRVEQEFLKQQRSFFDEHEN